MVGRGLVGGLLLTAAWLAAGSTAQVGEQGPPRAAATADRDPGAQPMKQPGHFRDLMPRVRARPPGPVPMPQVTPSGPEPVPMPQVTPWPGLVRPPQGLPGPTVRR